MHGLAQPGGRRFRIFVLDPTPLMRSALRRVIEESPEFAWAGESAEPDLAVQELGKTRPDLAIVEIAFADVSAIELIRSLRDASPNTRLIVFTAMPGTIFGDRCLRAGASGFVSKRQPTPTLLKALHRALEGEVWLDEDLVTQLPARLRGSGRNPIEMLTPMEFEVFRLIADGHTSIVISKKLHRSVRTIETYRHRIKGKLDLANATELAQYAMRCLMEWPTGSSPLPPHASDQPGESPPAPPALPAAEIAGAGSPPVEPAAPVGDGARGRALIVEDNIPTSSALAVTCRRLGYRTDIARTTDEAHTKLRSQPDVMLLDLRLADGDDGADILRTVRKEKLQTRVAVVTGLDDVAALEKVESLVPDAMFRKPVRFSDLELWLSAAGPRKSVQPY